MFGSDRSRGAEATSHSSVSDSFIKNSAEENNVKMSTKIKWLLWIPSLLDFVEHITRNVSMTLLAASATSMLRSTIVIFAALLGVFYLKNKLYRHHITSLVIITVGAFLVGFSLTIQGDGDEESKSLFTGILLLLLG